MARLDRNKDVDGHGRYVVIDTRKLARKARTVVHLAELIKMDEIAVQLGTIGDPDEFFVIKLKDEFAEAALIAYSDAAYAAGEREYAADVADLARRSGPNHPFCKRPD